jgi:hypothetical protein
MAKIEIKDLTTNLPLGQRYEGMIGGKISWAVQGVVSNVTWKFNVLGCAVSSYDQSDEASSMMPFAGVGANPQWYWAATGAITLTVTAKVNGIPATRAIEIKIFTPTVNSSVAATSASVIRTSPVGGRGPAEDRLFLEFKNGAEPGFQWTATVGFPMNPASAGDIATLQLIKVNRRKTRLNGQVDDSHTDDFVLDQQVHYGMNDDTGQDFDTIPVLTGGSQKFLVDDSPATFIERRGNRTYSNVDVAEDYIMLLMYKPTGGIWVAIGEVRWRWSASATYNAINNIWQTAAGAPPSGENQQLTPAPLITHRLPLWSENVTDTLEEDL